MNVPHISGIFLVQNVRAEIYISHKKKNSLQHLHSFMQQSTNIINGLIIFVYIFYIKLLKPLLYTPLKGNILFYFNEFQNKDGNFTGILGY